mgnify:CR=1 FL=1
MSKMQEISIWFTPLWNGNKPYHAIYFFFLAAQKLSKL